MSIDSEVQKSGDIYSKLDDAFEKGIYKVNWFGRVARGYDAYGEEKGRWSEVALVVAGFAFTLLTGAVTFCSVWGGYEMYADCIVALSNNERPPADIGHAGEWTAQGVIYTYFYFRQLHSLAVEGDYNAIQKIFNKLMNDEESMPYDDPKLYSYMFRAMKELARGTFISRSQFTLNQRAIELMIPTPLKDDLEQGSDENGMSQVTKIFEAIQKDLDNALSAKRYLIRSWKGVTAVKKSHGFFGSMTSLVTGVAVPAILGVTAAFSLIGTEFLIDDLAKHIEPLSAIGHVGEWPVNAVGFAYLAYKLNEWAITKEGDLVIAKEVIQLHIDANIDDLDEEQLNLLLQTGNDELENIASKCMFTSVPSSYTLKLKHV